VADGGQAVPLTSLQAELGRLLAKNRSEDNYLAGGAAILAAPNSQRFSRDLDYFQDSASRVASAYETDRRTLIEHGCDLQSDISQPGYISVVVRLEGEATKIEWAQDSAWRFMPVIRSDEFGYQLHPMDLATNKVLALAGRNEARDLLDTLYLHEHLLSLGPLVWAAVGKDPGFSPLSLLERLRRRSKLQPEELLRLDLTEPIDTRQLKTKWIAALEAAERFIGNRPPDEVGCLYFAPDTGEFVDPDHTEVIEVIRHYGRPGGVLPRAVDG
jgi:predicted nucleotidyltransferase component of viral defense system